MKEVLGTKHKLGLPQWESDLHHPWAWYEKVPWTKAQEVGYFNKDEDN